MLKKTTKCHAERCADLAKNKATIEASRSATVLRLQQEEHKANAAARAEIEAAEKAARDEDRALSEALAADARAGLYPLAPAFPNAPRDTAVKFSETIRTLNERSERELGVRLGAQWFALPFAAAHGIEARAASGVAWELRSFGGDCLGARVNAAREKILAGAHPLEIERYLRDLELAVVCVPSTEEPDRLGVLRTHAQWPIAAFEALEAERKQRKQQREQREVQAAAEPAPPHPETSHDEFVAQARRVGRLAEERRKAEENAKVFGGF